MILVPMKNIGEKELNAFTSSLKKMLNNIENEKNQKESEISKDKILNKEFILKSTFTNQIKTNFF